MGEFEIFENLPIFESRPKQKQTYYLCLFLLLPSLQSLRYIHHGFQYEGNPTGVTMSVGNLPFTSGCGFNAPFVLDFGPRFGP
jgi:hypothetical protein